MLQLSGNTVVMESLQSPEAQLRSTRVTARHPCARVLPPGGPPEPDWTTFTLSLLKTDLIPAQRKGAPAVPMAEVYASHSYSATFGTLLNPDGVSAKARK